MPIHIRKFQDNDLGPLKSCQGCPDGGVAFITIRNYPKEGDKKCLCLKCGAELLEDERLLLAFAVLKTICNTEAIQIPAWAIRSGA